MDGFQLRRRGEPVTRSLTAQRLVAFLALRQRPLQRVYVAGMLWPEVPEERALASLRSAIWRANASDLPIVRTVDSRLGLDGGVEVDVQAVTHLARRLIEGPDDDHRGFPAAGLVGELLPDWYDDWLVIERERLHQLCLHALESLAGRLIVAGRYGEAAETALSAIAGEPFRESAHRLLVQVYLAEGNASEAMRHYNHFRHTLRTGLGLEPTPQFQALVLGGGDVPVTRGRHALVRAE